MSTSDSPDQPGFSELYKIPLLIGVTGHRDLVPEEVPAIRTALVELLSGLRRHAPDAQIKLVSSMAEGADLLAAEVAQELGFGIVALLPYSEAQCRDDLTTEASRELFDRTMAQAERLEVPLPQGIKAADMRIDGEARDRQYHRAGVLVARYSSLLIAIWDGKDTHRLAGTARVVDFRRGAPISDEDSVFSRHDPLLDAEDNDLTYEIRCSRISKGSIPSAPQVLGFVTGHRNLGTISQGVPSQLATLLTRTAGFNRDVDEYAERIARHGYRLSTPSPHDTPESLVYIDRLYMAADTLSGHFGRAFIRALGARYTLWALLAFLLLAFKREHNPVLGFLTISGVLVIFGLGWLLALWAHRRSWHRRYLDYRALAEGLRVEFYWELAGVRALYEDEFAHESFLQKQDSDLEWIRAAMRSVSLRCALYPRVSWPNGFEQAFAAWVGDADPVAGSGQLHYYRTRSRSLKHRQEKVELIAHGSLIGGLTFGLVLGLDGGLAVAGHTWLSAGVHNALLWALALLTVYGAIFEIYLSEKADRALIRQYTYMDTLFTFASRELRHATTLRERLSILRALGHACLAEHAQWTLAHRDKRIEGMRW